MIPQFRSAFDAARAPKDALSALGFARGTWTPVLTFATPGDLSVTYSAQVGMFWKESDLIHLWFRLITSSFTHTTAANTLQITGQPYTASGSPFVNFRGTGTWGGITKAGYTHIIPTVGVGDNKITLAASGSGVAFAGVTAADTPTGGSMNLQGHVSFLM